MKSPTIRQLVGVSATLAVLGIGLALVHAVPIRIAVLALALGLLMGLLRPKTTWAAVLRPGVAIGPITYVVARAFRHDPSATFVLVLTQAAIIVLLADALLLLLVWRRHEWKRAA